MGSIHPYFAEKTGKIKTTLKKARYIFGEFFCLIDQNDLCV
jgi:hypothetical protein